MNSLAAQIQQQFRLRGAVTAGELCQALKVSQPTLSRELRRLKGIVRLGAARATRYAMAREVPGAGSTWPLYWIDAQGVASRMGTLQALEMGQWRLAQDEPWETLRGAEYPQGLYPGLPWFLDDLRPQGFLGRNFARHHGPALGFPPDPRDWTADQVVTALVRHGEEMPGAFVLGEEMLVRVQEMAINPPTPVEEGMRADVYPQLATAALMGEKPESSAAGEQPKFLTRVRRESGVIEQVIVKFSGSRDRPEEVRWADLLATEWIAGRVLMEHNIPAAETHLIEGGGRLFLESVRFDRTGEHGRRGVVTLWAVDGGFFAQPYTPWTAAAARLEAEKWLTAEESRRLAMLWWYGSLIANTDMHYGNVSFFLERNQPLRLAPVYDMLPMLYRPGTQGSLPPREFAPQPPPPEALDPWREAAALAEETWLRIGEEPIISEAFREVARTNRETVAKYRKRFGNP
jgi:hypothetical protein